MVVKTLAHARSVFAHLRKQWALTGRAYLVIDTETQAQKPYPSKDALTIGRATTRIWSICYQGVSYSFPTSLMNPRYPLVREWAELLWPIFLDKSVVVVAHNANYDLNIFFFDMGLPSPRKLWCTMIGGWGAAEYLPKGLKERAPLFGRYLRATKTVDFNNEAELAEYAEQDVVVAEEMYLMQRYGKFRRSPQLRYVLPSGNLGSSVKNPFYAPGDIVIENQGLSEFMKFWMTTLEFPVLRSTVRAEQRGFPFDRVKLAEIRSLVTTAKAKALKDLFSAAGCSFNPNSTRDLAKVVENLGIDYPFKTAKGAPSFLERNVLQVVELHPIFSRLLEYKQLAKLVSTYIGTEPPDPTFNNDCGLERWVNPTTAAIHSTVGTVNAITGRTSSSNPNLQQIPSRRDQFGIRHIFTATPRVSQFTSKFLAPRYAAKKKLIVLDYSQLELRGMCLYCKDPAMTKVLRDPKGDIHQYTADEFGVNRDPHAKNLNFLLIYGGQSRMLAAELTRMGAPTSESVAQGYVERHWEVYPRVKEQREEWCREHEENGCITLFFGRRRTLPDADWSNHYGRHRAETQLANNAVQGMGQDCLKAAIVRSDVNCIEPDLRVLQKMEVPKAHRLYLQDRVKDVRRYRRLFRSARCFFLLQVHDEIIFSCVPEAAAECTSALADIMSWRHFLPSQSDYNIPLVAEGGVGDTWKAAKAKDAQFHIKLGYEHWERYAK